MYSSIKVIERKSRNARVWSNTELKKVSPLFYGDVCNVSAWNDEDKEGHHYRAYFSNCKSYTVTNYHDSNARGSQGNNPNEILLNLTEQLPSGLNSKFEAVFNHTTLEHIFDCNTAIENLCKMSSDIVIIVVPFLQETHGSYGDYWRFTPQGVDASFTANGLKTIYLNYNEQSKDSIYVFAIGSRYPEKWETIQNIDSNKINLIHTTHIGVSIIKNSFLDRIFNLYYRMFNVKSENNTKTGEFSHL